MSDAVFRTEITADRAQFDSSMDAAAEKALTSAQRMQSAFREVNASVKTSMDGVKTSLEGVTGAVAKVQGVILALGAAIAGGAAFKSMVSAGVEWASEATKIAKALGSTTEQASILNVALHHVGLGAEEYIGAAAKMTRQLAKDEEAFRTLGVEVRDSTTGAYRNSIDIMTDVVAKLAAIDNATQRNVAAQKIFGRGFEEIRSILKINADAMQHAEERARELGLIVGPEGAERAKQYKEQMRDLNLVAKSLEMQIGNALVPVLTRMGQFMSGEGSTMADTFKRGLQGIGFVAGSVWLALKDMGDAIGALAAQAAALLRLDFAAATAIGKMRDEQSKKNEEAYERWKKEAFEDPKGASSPPPEGTTVLDFSKGKNEKDKKDPSQMAAFETELAEQRAAFDREADLRGSFQQMTKQQEADFWRNILEVRKVSDADKLAVLRKAYAAEREVRKEDFDAGQAKLKTEIEAAKVGGQLRIDLATEIARRAGEKYGLESKEYMQAQGEIGKYQREAAERARQLQDVEIESTKRYQLERVELEKVNLDTMEQLGVISTAQKLARLKDLKEIEFQIELHSAERFAEQQQNNVVAYEKALEQMERLRRKHELDMAQTDAKLKVEGIKPWRSLFDSITNGFSSAIKGVIMGTQTLAQAMKNILQTVVVSVIDMGVKMLAQMALDAIMGNLIEKTSALSKITSHAAVAAAGAYAATAAIPYIGPIIAPAAAATAFAGTMSWSAALASAAGGFDIPRGLNPVTQLHQEEMVLPASIANPLRESLATGGAGGAGGGEVHHHYHALNVTTPDARSFVQVLARDRTGFDKLVVDSLTRVHRNFGAKR
jgi:hypothetical protein